MCRWIVITKVTRIASTLEGTQLVRHGGSAIRVHSGVILCFASSARDGHCGAASNRCANQAHAFIPGNRFMLSEICYCRNLTLKRSVRQNEGCVATRATAAISTAGNGVCKVTRTLLYICSSLCAGSFVLIPAYAEGPSGQAEKSKVSLSQPGSLDDLSGRVEALVRSVSPSVLQIISESFVGRDVDPRSGPSTVAKQTGIGTGFLVSSDGDVITNAHVVAGARRVRVRIHELRTGTGEYRSLGRLIDAKVVGLDRETDLALLKLNGSWKHLPLADSSMVRQGQIVLALGNPRGLENSVSMGVVSATSRQIHPDASQAYIQTDAPINPGNSGGPLIDTHGEVVGVNTFIVTESGGSEGLGFAIPSNLVAISTVSLRSMGALKRRNGRDCPVDDA